MEKDLHLQEDPIVKEIPLPLCSVCARSLRNLTELVGTLIYDPFI